MIPFNLRGHLPHTIPRDYTFGAIPRAQFFIPGDKIYAFSVVERGVPRVFTYDSDADGLDQLSHLIRSETVLAVIRGRQLEIKTESVVSMTDGAELQTEHRTTLISSSSC